MFLSPEQGLTIARFLGFILTYALFYPLVWFMTFSLWLLLLMIPIMFFVWFWFLPKIDKLADAYAKFAKRIASWYSKNTRKIYKYISLISLVVWFLLVFGLNAKGLMLMYKNTPLETKCVGSLIIKEQNTPKIVCDKQSFWLGEFDSNELITKLQNFKDIQIQKTENEEYVVNGVFDIKYFPDFLGSHTVQEFDILNKDSFNIKEYEKQQLEQKIFNKWWINNKQVYRKMRGGFDLALKVGLFLGGWTLISVFASQYKHSWKKQKLKIRSIAILKELGIYAIIIAIVWPLIYSAFFVDKQEILTYECKNPVIIDASPSRKCDGLSNAFIINCKQANVLTNPNKNSDTNLNTNISHQFCVDKSTTLGTLCKNYCDLIKGYDLKLKAYQEHYVVDILVEK